MDWEAWTAVFEQFLRRQTGSDAAHGLDHARRVVANARNLARAEGAALAVVLPAAWLHDCVVALKDGAEREHASRRAAATAVTFLQSRHYPAVHLEAISHAIAAHSFSAGIPPRTLEAAVVQDADRLDALGAVGIARSFMVGGGLGRPIYHEVDPFCQQRAPDDGLATVDHFYTKLLRLPETMQTAAGRREAEARATFMRRFLAQLAAEVATPLP